MSSYIDPSTQTPLFVAQQVTCGYPISDTFANLPRYLYYALLVACLLMKWHPWLGDAFLGAAATYAGVAAIEAFILLAGFPKQRTHEIIDIPYINSSSLIGNATLSGLENLVTDTNQIRVWPSVMEFDIDAVLAIVVTGYLYMLPIHCWSRHIKSRRAVHLLMVIWNIMMVCATACSLVLFARLSDQPLQFRFCYPTYPDPNSVTNDGWIDSLWEGNWNSTLWNTFSNPDVYNRLIENCMYPCFNTSQVLRRPSSIVGTTITTSPRTNVRIPDSKLAYYGHLVYFMYAAISLSALTAMILFVMTATGMSRRLAVPLDRPMLLWSHRHHVKESIASDFRNIVHRTRKRLPHSGDNSRATRTSACEDNIGRRISILRLLANLIALLILFIVMAVIPATWIVFIVWIEWWIHRDLVSQETPRQVGQWAPAVSVALVLLSALILRLKYRLATREQVDQEIEELNTKLRTLEGLRELKF